MGSMSWNRWQWMLVLFFSAFSVDSPALPQTRPAPAGVVVEDVSELSTLAKAGLRVGDVVLSWERLPTLPANPEPASGEVDSFFDWELMRIEQAPRGTVRLTVRRGDETTTVDVPRGVWEVTVRAWMSPSRLAPYLAGKTQIDEGEITAGLAHWQTLADDLSDGLFESWLLLRIAMTWDHAVERDRAQHFYGLAFEASDNDLARAVILHERGRTYWKMNDYHAASEAFAAAHTIWQEKLGESLAVSLELRYLGIMARGVSEMSLSRTHFLASLAIRKRLAPGSLEVARILNNIGYLATSVGELDLASQSFHDALEIKQRLAPGSLDEARSLNNLAIVFLRRGELDRADSLYKRALAIRQQLAPGSPPVASGLSNLGNIAYNRGDLDLASAYQQRSLEIIQRAIPGGLREAAIVRELGKIAYRRGDLASAREFLQRSIDLQRPIAPRGTSVARTQYLLGLLALDENDLTPASKHFRHALDIYLASAPESLTIGDCFNGLGRVARAHGDWRLAEDYFRRALAIHRQQGPGSLGTTRSLRNLGHVALARGALEQANRYFERSLEIRKRAQGSAQEAAGLYDLAVLRRQQGRLEEALAYLFQALEAVETQIDRLGSSRDRQASFRAERSDYYRDTIELLLALRRHEEAFAVLERSRAQTFLAQLAERDPVFTADLPAELDRERRSLAIRFDRTQAQLAGLHSGADREEIVAIHEELRRLRNKAEALEESIRDAYPHLAALTYPEPLDLDAIRQSLDPGTVLLAFNLGESKTNVFAVRSDAPLVVETLPIGEDQLSRRVEGLRTMIETTLPGSRRMVSLEERARALYDTLLAPLDAHIEPAERLLILPDGPLYYLPWAALRRPSTDGGETYLLEHKPLHVAVSATVYAELKRDRRPRTPTDFRVAAFGDPRYPGSSESASAHSDAVVRSAGEREIFDWQALPHSRREVESLAALYPRSSRAFLGSEATEEAVKSLPRDTRIVHFATHGHMDERFPMNSFLALSIPEETEERRDNGLLQVWEIYESLRIDADLVVLSACASGIGQELRGEGIMGLTRAFHYAGARSVLATLWSVEDASSAELMVRFHRHLRAGLAKDEALRAAQLELLAAPIDMAGVGKFDARAPRSWAAFQLYGDWQ